MDMKGVPGGEEDGAVATLRRRPEGVNGGGPADARLLALGSGGACARVLWEKMSHHDEARTLLRTLYSTEADLVPDEGEGTLTVRLHHLANRAADEAVRHLCADLNSTETLFPGTNLRLVYEMVSSKNPRPQEV
jgi:hypothetical protein